MVGDLLDFGTKSQVVDAGAGFNRTEFDNALNYNYAGESETLNSMLLDYTTPSSFKSGTPQDTGRGSWSNANSWLSP